MMSTSNKQPKEEILLLKEVSSFEYDDADIETHQEGKPMILKGILQRANTLNQNGRVYPRHILERELHNYEKLIRENRAFGELDHCLPEHYEILTVQGWKSLADISESEKIYTLNTETGNVEEETILKKVEYDYSGDLVSLRGGRNVRIETTPMHNVLLWDRSGQPYKITADNLCETFNDHSDISGRSWLSHSHIKVTGDTKALLSKRPSNTTYTVPGTAWEMAMKTWCSLLGIWLAEGYVAGSKGGDSSSFAVGITQKKADSVIRIRELLAVTGMPWKEYSSKDGKVSWCLKGDEQVWTYFSQFGNSHTKFIPQEILEQADSESLSALHDWVLVGDGKNRACRTTPSRVKNAKGSELAVASNRFADGFAHLLFLLGKNAGTHRQHQLVGNIRGRSIYPTTDLYVCSENTANIWLRTFGKLACVKEQYNGKVRCVSTVNGNFMARYVDPATRISARAFWTGNCDTPIVNMKNISHVIREIWMEGDVVYGKVEVLPTPSGKIIEAIISRKCKPGISSRALGSLQKENNVNMVQDDLQIICWDFVSDPSTPLAFMSLAESKIVDSMTARRVLTKSDLVDRAVNDVLRLQKSNPQSR